MMSSRTHSRTPSSSSTHPQNLASPRCCPSDSFACPPSPCPSTSSASSYASCSSHSLASTSTSPPSTPMGPPLARTRSGEDAVVLSERKAFASWEPQEYQMTSNAKAALALTSSPELVQSPTMGSHRFDAPMSPRCGAPVTPEVTVMSQESLEEEEQMEEDVTMELDEADDDSSSCETSEPSSCGMSPASSRSSATSASSCPSQENLPTDCFPSSSPASLFGAKTPFPPSQWTGLVDQPCTFPGPTPTNKLGKEDLESCLRFANFDKTIADNEASAPPAFFPLQRVSFAPQLKVKTAGGVPLAMGQTATSLGRDGIAGMMLGVTGMIEILDAEKTRRTGKDVIKSTRMVADFATDLTNGLRIWRRDAAPIVKEKLRVERQWRLHYGMPVDDLDDPSWEEMLAPGTFMLPLSMKIPCSDKLPPSFESAHYRIRYTMSLAIFGSRRMPDGRPEILHVHSMPFHILPSTLPTPAPRIPILTHDGRKGGFLAGITRALSLTAPSPGVKPGDNKTCTHIICPSIPTSSYSPGSVIPITLRIADCPTEPTDLYIRLSLIRKIYVRDSAYETMNEWGLPDDIFFEEFCKEEEEIVSRWGYVPYSVRAKEGAMPGQKAQVIISDITLPVGGASGEWTHGYSSSLDLGPSPCPTMKHGECSWFSPALSARSPVKADYERYLHISARHFVSIEVGFASDRFGETLAEIGESVPEMEIPQPNTFTYPCAPSTSALTGNSTVNPFPVSSPSAARTRSSRSTPFQHAPQLPCFPGKVKEILIPVTIGSVAEPQMQCIVDRLAGAAPASIIPPSPPRATTSSPASTPEQSAERAARDLDESESERHERVGSDGEEAWLCPPPSYAAAVTSVPAYV